MPRTRAQKQNQMGEISQPFLEKQQHQVNEQPREYKEQVQEKKAPQGKTLTTFQNDIILIKNDANNLDDRSHFRYFSCAQRRFKLKFDSMFLSYAIYLKYKRMALSGTFQPQYVKIVCLFLATKYEEIYHPNLRAFVQSSKMIYDKPKYRKLEVQLLKTIKYNLHIPNPKYYLGQFIKDHGIIAEYHAYYLLEMGLLNKQISEKYTVEEICQAIIFSMSSLHAKYEALKTKKICGIEFESDYTQISSCSKELISKRGSLIESGGHAFKKYQDPYLHSVALQPLLIVNDEDCSRR